MVIDREKDFVLLFVSQLEFIVAESISHTFELKEILLSKELKNLNL